VQKKIVGNLPGDAIDALLNTSKGEFYRSIGSREKEKNDFQFDGIKKWANF
jgi:hypothetical protein